MTAVAVVDSELTSDSHNNHIFATPHEDAAFHGSGEDEAVFTVIDIDIGSHIEDEVETILAPIDIELLPFQ